LRQGQVLSLSADFNTQVQIHITFIFGEWIVDGEVIKHGMELGLVGRPPQTVIAVDNADHVRVDEQTWVKRGTLEATLCEAFGKVLTPDVRRARMAVERVFEAEDPLARIWWSETLRKFEVEFVIKWGLGESIFEIDTTGVEVAYGTNDQH